MSGPLNLTLPTGNAKTSMPKLVEDTYIKVRLNAIKQDTVENKGDTITFEFNLSAPAPNQDGGTISPGQMGSKMFHTLYLYGKDGAEAAALRATESISKILDGVLGTGDPDNKKGKQPRPDFGPQLVPALIGQETLIKVRNPKGDRTSQDIVSFTYPGDVAGA